MLKHIRNMKFGWIIILLGLGAILSGLSLTQSTGSSGSLLCLDYGCLYVQGMSNIVIGILFFGLGIWSILRK